MLSHLTRPRLSLRKKGKNLNERSLYASLLFSLSCPVFSLMTETFSLSSHVKKITKFDPLISSSCQHLTLFSLLSHSHKQTLPRLAHLSESPTLFCKTLTLSDYFHGFSVSNSDLYLSLTVISVGLPHQVILSCLTYSFSISRQPLFLALTKPYNNLSCFRYPSAFVLNSHGHITMTINNKHTIT